MVKVPLGLIGSPPTPAGFMGVDLLYGTVQMPSGCAAPTIEVTGEIRSDHAVITDADVGLLIAGIA